MPKSLFAVSRRYTCACVLVAMAGGGAGTAQAWGLNDMVMQNMAYDQQFNNQLYGMMANTQAQQQQLMQAYIQAYGSRLEQDYRQYTQTTGMQIPFEQFVYYHMLTAGGTNAAPALQQQQQNFQALQQANRSLQQGYDSYNQGWQNNSNTTSGVMERYSNEAIGGNAYYANPYTGETYNLPYTSGSGYYGGADGTFYQDPGGRYYEVEPGGFYQEMQPVYPYYGD